MDGATRGMAGMNINEGRTSQEGRRPPTASSGRSQNSGRSASRGQPFAAPHGRTSNDGYGPDSSFGPPSRAMTMPQNNEDPYHNPRMPTQTKGPPDRGYDGLSANARNLQDPILQRSYTSVGEMRGPIQAPQRPSTAAGTRPGPNAGYAPPSEMF